MEDAARDVLGVEAWEKLDPFDQVQLAYVLEVCRRSRTPSEAGRALFRVSRLERKHTNDVDRLSKYLTRFGLSWEQCGSRPLGGKGPDGLVADAHAVP